MSYPRTCSKKSGTGEFSPSTDFREVHAYRISSKNIVSFPGARVWLRDPEKVWIGGELIDGFKFSMKSVRVLLEDGQVSTSFIHFLRLYTT